MRQRVIFGMAGVLLASALASAQPLAGTYTINRFLPAVGTNFNSLASAVAALVAGGVSAPVTFDIYDDDGMTGLPSPFTESTVWQQLITSGNITWGTSTAVLVLANIATASPTNRITFQEAAGENVQFNAAGTAMGIAFNGASYVTIRGIEIYGALYDGISLYNDANMNAVGPIGNIIEGCNIHNCSSAGIVLYGNVPGPQNTIIRNNFLWNLQTAGTGGFYGNARFGYISSRRCQGTVIEFNTFYVNTLDALNAADDPFCAVIGSTRGAPSSPMASIRNNLFVKVPTTVNGTFYRWRDGINIPNVPTSMDYNLYDDTSAGTFMVDVGTTYANLGAFQAASVPREANGRTGAASLVNAAMGDLHIQLASAAVGAADPAATLLTDFDGEARPGGCARDVGADEVAESGPVAAFNAVPAGGPAPLVVNFSDASYSCAGGILTWAWDFNGDAMTDSTIPNPTFIYTCPGIYTVSLTVGDPQGFNTITVNNMINVGDYQFAMSTSGPGPNQFDLTITPVPSTCPNAMGAVQGFTLISLSNQGNPVGSGPFFGLVLDAVTFNALLSPIGVGNPLHFLVTGVTYPDGGNLVLPAPLFAPLAGLRLDATQVFLDGAFQVVLVSNTAGVQF